MKVVLTSQGSTGDIFPMIAFARSLQQAGHEVTLATVDVYQREIEGAGITFFQLPPYWKQQELSYWMGRLQHIRGPIFQLNALYKAALPYLHSMIDLMDKLLEGKDVLVSSYLFPMNKFLADRRGIAFATFAFAHNTVPSKFYPPEDLPRAKWLPMSWQMKINTVAWQVGNRVVDYVINRTIAKPLSEKSLPPVVNFFSKPADLVLVALSPRLMKPPYKLDARFQFVGYSRWQSRISKEVQEQVEQFTQGKKVPVVTFGSMVYQEPEKTLRLFLSYWPREQKIIIQKGWAQFPSLPEFENVLVIGDTCHDWLFGHASVVIHHGGAGTTASVLYSGKPQIVVPHIGDQNFFGKEVERLGVGLRCPKKKWPKQLYHYVERTTEEETFAYEARKAKEKLEREEGHSLAVSVLEEFVASKKAILADRLR